MLMANGWVAGQGRVRLPLLLVGLLCTVLLWGCSGVSANSINVQQLNDLLQDQPELVLVDVRETQELQQEGKIKQSIHLALSQLEERYTELPKDQKIYLYCRSGNRSGQAQAFLLSKGYQAINVEGSMNAWKSAGYPVEY